MRNRDIGIVCALFFVTAAACCRLSYDDLGHSSNGIRKVLNARISNCGPVKVELTRTAIEYNAPDPSVADTHRVRWTDGDVVYSYSESGVYMSDVLTDSGTEPDFTPSNPYESKIEIIYREGDEWFNAYFKGKCIGNYAGRRTQYNISFDNGIPNLQNGKFEDYHIGIATAHPLTLDGLCFNNMQSYLRFKTIGNEKDNPSDAIGNGRIDGKKVHIITIRNLVNETESRPDDIKERMAGNLEMDIEVPNAWKYKLLKRVDSPDELKDTMITVIPETDGGYFSNGREYFVAIPVRPYLRGLQLDFYGIDGNKLSSVRTPRITLGYNRIYDCDDILQYILFLCQSLSFSYGGTDIGMGASGTGITVEEGHTGQVEVTFHPSVTTQRRLTWSSADTTVAKVSQSGEVTGVSGGEPGSPRTCVITVKTTDGSNLEYKFRVSVVTVAGISLGDYTEGNYGGEFEEK